MRSGINSIFKFLRIFYFFASSDFRCSACCQRSSTALPQFLAFPSNIVTVFYSQAHNNVPIRCARNTVRKRKNKSVGMIMCDAALCAIAKRRFPWQCARARSTFSSLFLYTYILQTNSRVRRLCIATSVSAGNMITLGDDGEHGKCFCCCYCCCMVRCHWSDYFMKEFSTFVCTLKYLYRIFRSNFASSLQVGCFLRLSSSLHTHTSCFYRSPTTCARAFQCHQTNRFHRTHNLCHEIASTSG